MARITRLVGLLLVSGMASLGCTEATPDYCTKPGDCPSGYVCDVARAVCVSTDGSLGAGGALGSDGALGAGGAFGATDVAPGEAGTGYDADRSVDGADDAPLSGDAGEADASIVDAGSVDAWIPDVYTPDGAGTCGSNGDCTDPARAFCVGNVCVGCQPSPDGGSRANTCAAPSVCDPGSGMCVECTNDTHCTKDPAKGFCVAHACTGCGSAGATGCAARTDGKTTCAADGTAAGQCVECVGDAECKAASKSFCVAHVCSGCQSALASACATRAATKPLCSTSGALAGQCVECSEDADCKDPTKSFCVANVCGGCQTAAATACATRSASKPVCATAGSLGGQCVECSEDADCKSPAKSFCVANVCGGCQTAGATACATRSASKPVCAPDGALGGQCVACLVDTDCKVAAAPICTASSTCVACTSDSQCVAKLGANPGVCMAHQDGRCATDGETIYVTTSALQTAVDTTGTNASKRLIVLRSLANPVAVTSATQVSIVGQGTAGIVPTLDSPGITLSGTGNLYVRDVKIVGGSATNAGISAGAGTTLRLERVKVLDNGGGGILLNGAAFDLNDVLVSGNGAVTDGSVSWSGIFVKALPNAGSATKLSLVSVVDNGNAGLICAFAVPSTSGANTSVYASGNGGGVNINATCGLTACTPALVGTCGSSLTP
jgi:hypothetical protein